MLFNTNFIKISLIFKLEFFLWLLKDELLRTFFMMPDLNLNREKKKLLFSF